MTSESFTDLSGTFEKANNVRGNLQEGRAMPKSRKYSLVFEREALAMGNEPGIALSEVACELGGARQHAGKGA